MLCLLLTQLPLELQLFLLNNFIFFRGDAWILLLEVCFRFLSLLQSCRLNRKKYLPMYLSVCPAIIFALSLLGIWDKNFFFPTFTGKPLGHMMDFPLNLHCTFGIATIPFHLTNFPWVIWTHDGFSTELGQIISSWKTVICFSLKYVYAHFTSMIWW